MTKNIERIENLKKEMVKAYGKKGIVESLYDLKISLKKPAGHYSSSDLYNLFHKKLTTHYRKLLSQASTLNEVIKLGETVSFGQSKVVITPLYQSTEIPVIEVKKDRIVELLGDFIKLKVTPKNRSDVQAQHWPFEVSLKYLRSSRWVEKTGYTFAKDTFPKSVFKNKYGLRTYPDMQLEFIFDLSVVLAEAFLTNSIEKFALANQEWLQYAIAHEMTSYTYGSSMDVPVDETYRKDLECIRKKYNIKTTCEIEREVKYLNDRFRDAFYLTLIDGYVAKAAHSDIYRWVLPEILSQMKYIKDKTLRRIQQTSDYAKSFQTKKNINKATQTAMNHNTFLEIFGYVELDNDVGAMRS